MPQTFNVGARSRFVTFIAWLAIVLAASTVAWAALQMASQPSWAALAAGRRDLPWLVARLLRGLPWIHAGAIALSLRRPRHNQSTTPNRPYRASSSSSGSVPMRWPSSAVSSAASRSMACSSGCRSSSGVCMN